MDSNRVLALCADLKAEHEALDSRVGGLDPAGWTTPTPAEGWAVRDQISHLAYFDVQAGLALTDPEEFKRQADAMLRGEVPVGDTDLGRSVPPARLLASWRTGRAALLETAAGQDPNVRVAWYGPPMGLASFITARLMETWAHGQDVADALGLPPVVSERLRHVVHIGVGARAYSFMVHGVTDPGDPVRVEAHGPSGDVWTWGPDDAADLVSGDAVELALLLTQRRHRDDVTLKVEGAVAEQWLSIAQSFAGPAGTGRAAGMPRVAG
ncbi:MAG TPA: TIGR03084 family metal-binding protein [Acidimicrobiales bacterium]|jgi:uncharacterized protein (TIGR03084 family)|nr:TIGR03084 family metal-binding protein [Acidimicrobiales bacterium]